MKTLVSDVAAGQGCVVVVPDLFIHALAWCVGNHDQIELTQPIKKKTRVDQRVHDLAD